MQNCTHPHRQPPLSSPSSKIYAENLTPFFSAISTSGVRHCAAVEEEAEKTGLGFNSRPFITLIAAYLSTE